MFKSLGICLATAVVFVVVTFLCVQWDLLAHPWVGTTQMLEQWSWYNYLTSEHSPTVFYLLHFNIWLTGTILISLVVGAFVTAKLSD